MMPGMNGYQVVKWLRANPVTRDMPVIFVTGMNSAEDELTGLDAGVVDYVTKPVVPRILLARIRAQLELKKARDWLSEQNRFLEVEIAKRLAENELIQEVSIRALARLAETRDPETGNHILRTQATFSNCPSVATAPAFHGPADRPLHSPAGAFGAAA